MARRGTAPPDGEETPATSGRTRPRPRNRDTAADATTPAPRPSVLTTATRAAPAPNRNGTWEWLSTERSVTPPNDTITSAETTTAANPPGLPRMSRTRPQAP